MSESTAVASKTETFVVYGGHYWGRGTTVSQAKANFRKQGGKLSGGYAILTFDADTTFHGVDEMGRYHWVGNAPTEQVVKARKS